VVGRGDPGRIRQLRRTEQCGQGAERLQQPAVEMEKVDEREERESGGRYSQMD
jgi:hypothetical protein